ncbi:glycosyltransferase, partial [Candidatus Pacearchaeota archaeon]|nr:glycosyltransferase [Candidatus Pacearchaeota archaeon]
MAHLDKTKPQVPIAILPYTTLCAIVRDEMINPAQLPGKSGIRSFVESHVPYVEQAVIVDTGSVDGTRQELEQLQAEFPNLKVQYAKFEGYAQARNLSIDLAETPRVLVLDADEVITPKYFSRLLNWLQNSPDGKTGNAFSLDFFEVVKGITSAFGHNPRLFDKREDRRYFSGDWKYELLGESRLGIPQVSVKSLHVPNTACRVYHFLPKNLDHLQLKLDWYNTTSPRSAPSKFGNFEKK